MSFRSGFCCFVGRPNAGKSTLTNALVGSKVAITSDKPQTTRRAIRGILNRPDGQLVVVDTPGFHRPRTLLGQRLNDIVLTTLNDVDVVGFCVPANQRIGPGDRFIAELIREAALADLRDELPHSTAVTVEEMRPREGQPDLIEIFATIHVERDSQKGIVIGPGGSRLRAVGTTARAQIERLLGQRVYLDLHVSVMADWQRDPKKLDRLGF